MDICALDGVHDRVSDKLFIIELNDSAAGFVERHYSEDMQHTRELILGKAKKHLMKQMQDFNLPVPK